MNNTIENDIQILNSLYCSDKNLCFKSHDDQIFYVRDNCYAAIAYWKLGGEYKQRGGKIVQQLIKLYRRYDYKIDWILHENSSFADTGTGWKRLHPRFDHEFREVIGDYGWVQNDAIGLLLWTAAMMSMSDPASITIDSDDYHTLQKLVWYLIRIEYWKDLDNGTWGENAEVHASSVGCCFSGIETAMEVFGFKNCYMDCGEEVLYRLVPTETYSGKVDIASLVNIYPLMTLNLRTAVDIISNVHRLDKNYGLTRYADDNTVIPIGIAWLALAHLSINGRSKATELLNRLDTLYVDGKLLPRDISGNIVNDNNHLAWSHSLAIILKLNLVEVR